MSIKLMVAAIAADLPASRKMVLVVIADIVNDEGAGCYFSMATIARKAGMSERAAQNQISQLIEAGYLSRQDRPGRSCLWFIDPRRFCTPAKVGLADDCPADVAPAPAASAPETALRLNPQEPYGSTPKGGKKSKGDGFPNKLRKNGCHRLPMDWQPDPLPDQMLAAVNRLGAAWFERQRERLALWARSQGRRAMKSDWQAFWVLWIDNALEKEGVVVLQGSEEVVEHEQPCVALADRENPLCRLATEALSPRQCRAWFEGCEIVGWVITARSGFAASQVREHVLPRLRIAAIARGLAPDLITVRAGLLNQ